MFHSFPQAISLYFGLCSSYREIPHNVKVRYFLVCFCFHRETYHGRIETSTPYVFFVFPPWFKRKYPELMSTLEINRNRLSSHFDVHETLRDLMYLKEGARKAGTVKERGISLFREIPKERTCAEAGIPGEFCVCGRFYETKLTHGMYFLLASTLLDEVNSFVGFSPTNYMTYTKGEPLSLSSSWKPSTNSAISSRSNETGISFSDFNDSLEKALSSKNSSDSRKVVQSPPEGPSDKGSNFREMCARLSLQKIESVYQVTNDQLQSLSAKSYRVTIRTVPGSALFEGLVNHEEMTGAQVIGDVVRINMYRGQADCVEDPWLRQFCFCLK